MKCNDLDRVGHYGNIPIHAMKTAATRSAVIPLLILVLALLCGCAASIVRSDAAQALEFVIVRHAEKVADGTSDPPLTGDGHARAAALAAILSTPHRLRAVYATPYQRTQHTAAPAAQAHGLHVTDYDAKQPALDFAAVLRRTHSQGTVLVVGHSNTVPEIVTALCACQVMPMPDHEYDRLSIIRIDAGGRARLEQSRY